MVHEAQVSITAPDYTAEVLSAKNAGAEIEGFLIGATKPHWTSPKMADFQSAMKRYVPGGVLASYSEMAWAGGKLIEAISKDFPDKPTSADFLKDSTR